MTYIWQIKKVLVRLCRIITWWYELHCKIISFSLFTYIWCSRKGMIFIKMKKEFRNLCFFYPEVDIFITKLEISKFVRNFHSKNSNYRGWRCSSVNKNTALSFRGPGFMSQHPLSLTLVAGNLAPPHRHTCRENTNTYTNLKDNYKTKPINN